VKKTNKKFNDLDHEFEIILTENSKIIESKEDENIPKIDFNFIKIKDLANIKSNSLKGISNIIFKNIKKEQTNRYFPISDIIAIIKSIKGIKISTKNGLQLKRQDIILIDDSQSKVMLIKIYK